jgi:hypothetical protein
MATPAVVKAATARKRRRSTSARPRTVAARTGSRSAGPSVSGACRPISVWQIITFNPAAHVEIDPVRKPKALVWTDERVARWQQTGEKPSPVMVWTPEQTGAFLDFVAEDRLYPMWHLIAFRGLRRGEACGQPWSETNLDRHSLTVTGQLVQDG